ncbi:pectate lyase B [Mucidula mucida]|nr:pectate lyase B [Mucidula mucida]
MRSLFTFLSLAILVSAQAPVNLLTGYGAGTTGGGNATPVTVSTCAALESAIGAEGPAVVKITSTISGCGVLDIEADKTVLGVGSSGRITGGGFRVRRTSNVIIRNLIFHQASEGDDLISIDEATNVWVDHNEFSNDGLVGDKDFYDGLVDIKHASDFITVSWNVFTDHWKGSLLGHSDNNAAEDTGFLHITFHHNLWNNVNSRTPSVRFGTAHVYNSVYTNIPTSGVHSRMGAQLLVESNTFTNVNLAIVTQLDSKVDGFVVERNNVYTNSTTLITQTGTLTSVPYSYQLDSTSSIGSICLRVLVLASSDSLPPKEFLMHAYRYLISPMTFYVSPPVLYLRTVRCEGVKTLRTVLIQQSIGFFTPQ